MKAVNTKILELLYSVGKSGLDLQVYAEEVACPIKEIATLYESARSQGWDIECYNGLLYWRNLEHLGILQAYNDRYHGKVMKDISLQGIIDSIARYRVAHYESNGTDY